MLRPFGNFIELGYVTNDLKRALGQFEEHYGISGWLETGLAQIDLGGGREAQLTIAVLYVGNVLLEVQEPVAGEIGWYRDMLAKEDDFSMRLHHLGFAPPDAAAYDTARHSLSLAHAIVAEGRFGSASRFFFADARATLGHYLEYIDFGPEFQAVIPRINPPIGSGRSAQLAGLNQIAYVTADYARALQVLRETYRMDHFLETGPVTMDLGMGAPATLRAALGYIDNMQIEVIEPIDGAVGIYRDVLARSPDALLSFHHLSFGSANPREHQLRRMGAAERGQTSVLEGKFATESGYFYIDGRKQLGHHLEYAYLEPAFDELIPRN